MIKSIFAGAASAAVILGAAYAQDDAPFEPAPAPIGDKGSFYFGVGLGFGEVTADGASQAGFPDGSLDYDGGFAGSLLAGYNLSDFFAVEAEVTGRTNDFDGNIGDADFTVSTLMAGAVVKAPLPGGFEPYAGAALGLVSTNLEDADNAFGYQLKGGLRKSFRGRHAIGAEASFVFTDGYEARGTTGDVELEYEHAAYMLTYRFTSR